MIKERQILISQISDENLKEKIQELQKKMEFMIKENEILKECKIKNEQEIFKLNILLQEKEMILKEKPIEEIKESPKKKVPEEPSKKVVESPIKVIEKIVESPKKVVEESKCSSCSKSIMNNLVQCKKCEKKYHVNCCIKVDSSYFCSDCKPIMKRTIKKITL